MHAAAWSAPDGEILLVREDVGRHNALDKLVGGMATAGLNPIEGFAVITSRCSHEMAQKAIVAGIGVLAAMAAPTRMALAVADAGGLALAAWAGGPRCAVLTQCHVIAG